MNLFDTPRKPGGKRGRSFGDAASNLYVQGKSQENSGREHDDSGKTVEGMIQSESPLHNMKPLLRSPYRSPSRYRDNPLAMKNLFRDNLANSPRTREPVRGANRYSGDRFIPSRSGSNLRNGYDLPATHSHFMDLDEKEERAGTSKNVYKRILETEILGNEICQVGGDENRGSIQSPNRTFRFRPRSPLNDRPNQSQYQLSHVSRKAQLMIKTPVAHGRKIPKSPFKVLDAPSLCDDFYLNLVDWSSKNVLAVGLAQCVYLWQAKTSKHQVTKLVDLSEDKNDSVCSVCWRGNGSHVAIGTRNGDIQLWDANTVQLVRTWESGHMARVGTLAWNGHTLASGSRDRFIYLRDHRSDDMYTQKLAGHRQEVCGLKWSFDDKQLASGGNDNKLMIWSIHSQRAPVMRFNDHTAAVKAIAWSPHCHGLLASGGGTADRKIRFWNTLTSIPQGESGAKHTPLHVVETGSQVCNLLWSKNVNELVSTHGYSLNQIIVWKYPTMTKLMTLTGHTYRVLYLANSPDGQTIVTGAGDETLRFWNVFPTAKPGGPRFSMDLLR